MQAQGSFLEIVRLCLNEGSPAAWEQLVRRIQPVFARAAYRVACECGSVQRADIDDLVQDSLLKIAERGGERLRKLPFDSDSAAIAYLYEIGVNAARDHYRVLAAAKRGLSVTGSIEEVVRERISSFPTTPDVERMVMLGQIDGCLKAAPRDRTVFWLYYRTGLTAKEIAGLPAIDLGAKGVESLVFRLTKAVKECLEGKGRGARGAF